MIKLVSILCLLLLSFIDNISILCFLVAILLIANPATKTSGKESRYKFIA